MRSLKIAEDDTAKLDAVDWYQIKKDREWDKRYISTSSLICVTN